MVLTNKQKEELSILSYLYENNYTSTYNAFSKECNIIVDSNNNNLLEKKWTAVIKLQKKIMELESQIETLNEDLKLLSSGNIKKLDISDMVPKTCKHTLTGHRETINSIKFHPIYNLLATASDDTTIKFWDFESGSFERTLKSHTESVEDLAFNKNGTLLASSSNDLTIKLWDLENDYTCIKTLYGHDHSVSSVVFSPSGEFVISCSRDKSIKVWDTASGFCTRTLNGHDQWVRHLSISGDYICSASNDQTAKLWLWKNGVCTQTLRDHDHVVETTCFTNANADLTIHQTLGKDVKNAKDLPGGAFVATGCRDKAIRIFAVETGNCVLTFTGHDNWVRSILFHPNGKYIISSADDRSIRIWDISKNRMYKKIDNAHENFISCLDWSNTYPALASGSIDSLIKIWELK